MANEKTEFEFVPSGDAAFDEYRKSEIERLEADAVYFEQRHRQFMREDFWWHVRTAVTIVALVALTGAIIFRLLHHS